jgi:hypothetical protein
VSPPAPPPIQALLLDLRLDRAGPSALAALDDAGWAQACGFADRHGLTLLLRERLLKTCRSKTIPGAAQERLERNFAANTLRQQRLEATFAEVAVQLRDAGLEFVVLKGLAQTPEFVEDLRARLQYDLDLYLPPGRVSQARDVLLRLGYEPLPGFDDRPIDHLPTLVRKTGWEWRGDFFDAEIPCAVDLHFRFWDDVTEGFPAPGTEAFWDRRRPRDIAGQPVHVLDPADQLAYAALHALRHLLRGSQKLLHVCEIGGFLERRRDDHDFWTRWRGLHPPELRRLQTVMFRLAEIWFGAPRPAVAEALPAPVEAWLEQYGWSPVEAAFRPNKHELYLHLSLLDSWGSRWRVLRRRLLPLALPRGGHGAYLTTEQKTLRRRLRVWRRDTAFRVSRAVHHARLVAPTLWGLWRRP